MEIRLDKAFRIELVKKALTNGFYVRGKGWMKGSFVKIKYPSLKLDYKTHSHLVLSTSYKKYTGYEEYEIDRYGIDWALTKEELENK